MAPTGRTIRGPACDLVELSGDKGLKHTALVFEPRYRDHHCLTSSLQGLLPFLEDPGVQGLLKLSAHDPEAAAFVYPTGTVWSVAEVVRWHSSQGKIAGTKAGLELCYLAAEILLEASEVGEEQGVHSHGALSPWRIFLKSDGQIRIAGYGVPQADVVLYTEDDTQLPAEDSFRYCPPERIERQPEDVSSDLFSLTLIGLEVAMGKPVYDGLMSDIIQQATRGEGLRRLYQWRDKLPDSVREVLGTALKPDRDSRYRTGNDYVYAVHDLLTSVDVDGPSLVEVMHALQAAQSGKQVKDGQTATLSREEVLRMAAEMEKASELPPPRHARDDAEPEPPPEEEPQRWGKVKRPGRGAPEPPPAEAARQSAGAGRPATAAHGADRLKRAADTAHGADRLRRSDEAHGADRLKRPAEASKGAPSEPPKDARAELRDRLRSSRGATPPGRAEAPEPEPPKDEKREELRRSLRDRPRRLGRESEPPPEAPVEAPPAQEQPEEPPAPEEPPPPPPEPPPVEAPAEEPEEEQVPEEEEKPSGAAALLAKLRGSSGAQLKKTGGSGGSAALDRLRAKRSQAKDAEEVEKKEPEAPKPEAPKPEVPPAPPVDEGALGGPTKVLHVRVAGGETQDLEVPDTNLADAARHLAEVLGLIPVDLTGRVEGWYRIDQGEHLRLGSDALDTLDEAEVELNYVANKLVRAEILVEAENLKLSTVIGTAVPAGWLVGHLRRWLKLPPGNYHLAIGDEKVDPWQLLDDWEPKDGVKIVVRS